MSPELHNGLEAGKILGHFKVLIPQKGKRRIIHSLSKSVLSTGESGEGTGAPGLSFRG